MTASVGYRISAVTTRDAFQGLRDDWNLLVRNSHNDVVHLSHEWMTAWWNNFGDGSELNVLKVHDPGGRLIGIAPMMLSDSRYLKVRVKKLLFMANGHSPSADIIAMKGRHEEVVEALLGYFKASGNWDMIELFKLDRNGPTFRALVEKLGGRRFSFGIKNNIKSPYIPIDTSWNDFFDKRSTKFKKSIRNKLNRLKKMEDISIEKVPIRRSKEPVFDEMIKVSGNSWKKTIGTDLASNRQSKGFYVDLCDMLGQKGLIDLWVLRKGAEAIAFEFHIVYNGVIYPIRADFDMSFEDLSPGSVLEYNIIKSLFEGGEAREYNTCGHTYAYLMNWSENAREHANIEIFNSRPTPYILSLIEYNLFPIMKRMRNKVREMSAKGKALYG